jgi:hypothetical protein
VENAEEELSKHCYIIPVANRILILSRPAAKCTQQLKRSSMNHEIPSITLAIPRTKKNKQRLSINFYIKVNFNYRYIHNKNAYN